MNFRSSNLRHAEPLGVDAGFRSRARHPEASSVPHRRMPTSICDRRQRDPESATALFNVAVLGVTECLVDDTRPLPCDRHHLADGPVGQ